ncbi:MAG: T9SS type A sorting domain-containing protein [Saprospiraceae bacterium]|nr:T9SS type A sorting domain-containing protein [Saprospiraceae bacterium]
MKNGKMKYIIVFFVLISCSIANGQSITKRALFLGNSYTGVNNLPQMVADVTTSTGDTLIFGSNTPGGYTLQGHSTNATSLAKIAVGNWDYVVLQEQSQNPSFPISQVETNVFPYAHFLDSIINAENLCGETVFYMTWGRKNGDASNCASWPPVCTYSGMDSLLNLRYRMMADSNNAIVSPVGAVWKYIRQNFPLIDLYQSDESHPSVAGTYAAACSFYTALFRKDPTAITFNSTLSTTDAANIRTAAKLIVYDSLMNWHIGAYDPLANFTYSISNGNQVSFTNSSLNATNFNWNFGDGGTSASNNPTYTYLATGTYTIQLIANKCGISNTTFQTINITIPVGVNEISQTNNLNIFPNPVTTILNVKQDLSNKITYKIVSITGQETQTGIINNSEKQINVSLLSEGIYFLQLFDNNKSLGQQKFVKSAK